MKASLFHNCSVGWLKSVGKRDCYVSDFTSLIAVIILVYLDTSFDSILLSKVMPPESGT